MKYISDFWHPLVHCDLFNCSESTVTIKQFPARNNPKTFHHNNCLHNAEVTESLNGNACI